MVNHHDVIRNIHKIDISTHTCSSLLQTQTNTYIIGSSKKRVTWRKISSLLFDPFELVRLPPIIQNNLQYLHLANCWQSLRPYQDKLRTILCQAVTVAQVDTARIRVQNKVQYLHLQIFVDCKTGWPWNSSCAHLYKTSTTNSSVR